MAKINTQRRGGGGVGGEAMLFPFQNVFWGQPHSPAPLSQLDEIPQQCQG